MNDDEKHPFPHSANRNQTNQPTNHVQPAHQSINNRVNIQSDENLDQAMSALLALHHQLLNIQRDCQMTDERLDQLEASLARQVAATSEDGGEHVVIDLEEHNRVVQQLKDTLELNRGLATVVLTEAGIRLTDKTTGTIEAAAANALQLLKSTESSSSTNSQPSASSSSPASSAASTSRRRKRSIADMQ